MGGPFINQTVLKVQCGATVYPKNNQPRGLSLGQTRIANRTSRKLFKVMNPNTILSKMYTNSSNPHKIKITYINGNTAV